jgi:hypothetical protein
MGQSLLHPALLHRVCRALRIRLAPRFIRRCLKHFIAARTSGIFSLGLKMVGLDP